MLKSGDIVSSPYGLRVVLYRSGELRTYALQGLCVDVHPQELVNTGCYEVVANLEELVEFWQKHHRNPDLEIPGVIRIWVLEEGEGVPYPGCNISPTLSPSMQEVAWIWDGPRREVSSER